MPEIHPFLALLRTALNIKTMDEETMQVSYLYYP